MLAIELVMGHRV